MNNATDAKFDALYGTSSVHTFNGYSGTYFGDNTYGFVKTTMGLDGYCIQEVYNILTQSYWRRTKTSSAASWSSFTRADNFGYNTLSSLASALGVDSRLSIDPTSQYFGYFADLKQPGSFYFQRKDDDTGYPQFSSSGTSKWYWVFSFGTGDQIQICLRNNNQRELAIRFRGSGGEWNTWGIYRVFDYQ